MIPIAWVLMENKTRAGYNAVFRILKHLCPNLNPQTIISDWELPQQQAWQDAFPSKPRIIFIPTMKYLFTYFILLIFFTCRCYNTRVLVASLSCFHPESPKVTIVKIPQSISTNYGFHQESLHHQLVTRRSL